MLSLLAARRFTTASRLSSTTSTSALSGILLPKSLRNGSLSQVRKSSLALATSPVPTNTTSQQEVPLTLVNAVETSKHSVQLEWSDGHASEFHFSWLHANCTCDQCVTSSGQRTTRHNKSRGTSFASTIRCNSDQIEVGWSSNQLSVEEPHVSQFDARWLRRHCYDDKTLQVEDKSRTAEQNPMLTTIPRISFSDVMNTTEGCYAWLEHISSHGLCIVTDTPNEAGMVGNVAANVGPVSHTIYGDTFEVLAVPKPINVAYTDKALPPHMDLAYFESPPGIQMLHCRQFDEAVQGGESTFIDAHGVAEELRNRYPQAFDDLVQIPATFQKDHSDRATPMKMFYQRPHIAVNNLGSVISVFWSPPFEGPLRVPGDQVDRYYDAYAKFEELFEDDLVWEKYGTKLRVQEGEILCFNNRRLLHGRDAFKSENGVRHLEGCYLDIDMYLNKLRVLGSKLGKDTGSSLGCDSSRAGVGSHR